MIATVVTATNGINIHYVLQPQIFAYKYTNSSITQYLVFNNNDKKPIECGWTTGLEYGTYTSISASSCKSEEGQLGPVVYIVIHFAGENKLLL